MPLPRKLKNVFRPKTPAAQKPLLTARVNPGASVSVVKGDVNAAMKKLWGTKKRRKQ